MRNFKSVNKIEAQNRINQYFDSFQEVNYEGRSFNIMPSREEIPIVQNIQYYPKDDIFEVTFHSRDVITSKKTGAIDFLEDSEGKLIGIKIYKVKQNQVNMVKLNIVSTYEQVIKSAKIKVGSNATLKDVARFDIEDRKIHFIDDFVNKELPELVNC